ncbi:pirin family protein [Rhodococcoides trifolii]
MSAGTGRRLRVVQMWVPPTVPNLAPSYQERDVTAALAGGGLVTVAGEGGAVTIGNRDAALQVAQLEAGRSIVIPTAPFGHVFVAKGSAGFEGIGLVEHGDAVRLTDSGGQRLQAESACEVLVWEMQAAAPR